MREANFEAGNDLEQSISISETAEIAKDAKVEAGEIMELVSDMNIDSSEFLELKERFENIKPQLKGELLDYIEDVRSSPFSFGTDRSLLKYFDLIDIFKITDEKDKEIALDLFDISDKFKHKLAENISRNRKVYTSFGRDSVHEESIPEYVLKQFNLTNSEAFNIIKSWLTVEESEWDNWYAYHSLINMKKLEHFREGSVKCLYDDFGIHGFGRYTVEELIKQYDEKDNKGPYGLFFHAGMDWNGSFHNSNQSESLREKVDENGFMLRIIEARGKIDLTKRLLSLRNKYGVKIKFMYMSLHGNTDVIAFGDRPGNDRKFMQGDLKGKGVQRIKELFEDDAEIILSSCLTGAEGGLAEEISEVFNVKVIASDKPTQGEPKSVNVHKKGDNLEFEVEFNTADLEDLGKNNQLKGTVIYNPKNND